MGCFIRSGRGAKKGKIAQVAVTLAMGLAEKSKKLWFIGKGRKAGTKVVEQVLTILSCYSFCPFLLQI